MRRTNPLIGLLPYTSDAPAVSVMRRAIASRAVRNEVFAMAASRLDDCKTPFSRSRKSGARTWLSPSARRTDPAGPSPRISKILPPSGCASSNDAIRYCNASRRRDSSYRCEISWVSVWAWLLCFDIFTHQPHHADDSFCLLQCDRDGLLLWVRVFFARQGKLQRTAHGRKG